MNLGVKFILLFVLFIFLLLFLNFTQTLPYWVTADQATLMNNGVIITDMMLMILVALR